MVVKHRNVFGDSWVKIITFGIGNYKIRILSLHHFCKRISNGMGECFGVWRPGQYNLRFVRCRVFRKGNRIGKSLQGMTGSTFHVDDRNTSILGKTVQYNFCFVLFFVGQRCKGTYGNHITILRNNCCGFANMFGSYSAHFGAIFKFQRPCFIRKVHDHGIES